jgi:hypothetical protein
MRANKIVDTISNFGNAERFITFEADFKRFLEGKYKRAEILEVNPFQLVQEYNLKGFVFGNYVTQEERFHFLFKISKQLEVLAKVAGTKDLGKGILIIAFGAEGKAGSLAHYNPSKQLINLNRGRMGTYKSVMQGENSFIHEYGHFIDFMQGRADRSIPFNFSSENYKSTNNRHSKAVDQISEVVRMLYADEEYMRKIQSQSNAMYLELPFEMFARLFESVFTYYVMQNEKDYYLYFNDNKYTSSIYLGDMKIVNQSYDKKIVAILKSIKLLK